MLTLNSQILAAIQNRQGFQFHAWNHPSAVRVIAPYILDVVHKQRNVLTDHEIKDQLILDLNRNLANINIQLINGERQTREEMVIEAMENNQLQDNLADEVITHLTRVLEEVDRVIVEFGCSPEHGAVELEESFTAYLDPDQLEQAQDAIDSHLAGCSDLSELQEFLSSIGVIVSNAFFFNGKAFFEVKPNLCEHCLASGMVAHPVVLKGSDHA